MLLIPLLGIASGTRGGGLVLRRSCMGRSVAAMVGGCVYVVYGRSWNGANLGVGGWIV